MRGRFALLIALGLALSVPAVMSAQAVGDSDGKKVRKDIRHDRRELHGDRTDIRHDTRDIRQDRRDIRQDRRDVREDVKEGDVKDARQDRRGLRRRRRQPGGPRAGPRSLDRRRDARGAGQGRHGVDVVRGAARLATGLVPSQSDDAPPPDRRRRRRLCRPKPPGGPGSAPHAAGERRGRDPSLQRVRGGSPFRPRTPARRHSSRHLTVTLLLLLAALQGDTATFTIADFRFASGETLPVLRLHYRTLGRPERDARGIVRNAVLILHGTGGSGSQFLSPLFAGELYGPRQPLDTATHYLILPDNIGHGASSKPSDGLKARFPHYTYADMVAAQYRLVTEGLHVDRLLLVMGTSMGCMHAWLWAERHPDFMDGVVPLACAPTQIAGRNRMMRSMIIEDIRGDPEWRAGDYLQQPRGLVAALQILFLMGSSPLPLQRAAPTRDSADAYIARWLADRLAAADANDMLYPFG